MYSKQVKVPDCMNQALFAFLEKVGLLLSAGYEITDMQAAFFVF